MPEDNMIRELDSLKAALLSVSVALRETRPDLSWAFFRACETVRKAQERMGDPAPAETVLKVPKRPWEPVKAELEGGGSSWWHVCGECHGAIDSGDRYCRYCGRELIWE